MSKLLVASIGNPRRNPATKEYSLTRYVLSDGQGERREYESSYIFEALTQIEGIDRLVLIGTAGSLWNALYEYLCLADASPLRRPDLQGDDDYLAELNALHAGEKKSELDVRAVARKLEKLRESFDPRYRVKIIVMRYGLSNAEWDENLNVLREIEGALEDGDELYLDVTYSFRSLPIFQLLAISYFRNISRKRVELRMLSYGMFEASDEFGGSTPIVDLRRLYELMEYIKVAGEYRSFGTAYGLDNLLEPRAQFAGFSPEQLNLIKNLGDTVNINDMNSFQALVRNCGQVLRSAPEAGHEFPLLAHAICADIQEYFGDGLGDPIMTQFNLAKWHMQKKRYVNAVSTARETCVTFAMALCGDDSDAFARRDRYNELFTKLNDGSAGQLDDAASEFAACYVKLRRVRNMLAHPTSDFNADERRSLVNILVCDELRGGERRKAEDALRGLFGMRGGQARETCLRELEGRAGPAQRKARVNALAAQLSDPFRAVLQALRSVIEQLHECYQANYFAPEGDARVAANREGLRDALLRLREAHFPQ